MTSLLLLAVTAYTLHVKDVFQPPKPSPIEAWKSGSEGIRRPEEFQTSAHFALRGWLYKSGREGVPYVLFFYGSNEDLVHEAPRLAWLRDAMHVNAICFDYPGYGFSEGRVDLENIRSAAAEEFDEVQRHVAPPGARIVVYGWSIGTEIAIHVASTRPAAGLILQAPPASSDEMARWSSRHDVPWFGRGLVNINVDPSLKGIYEGASAIRRSNCPLLVIQGTLDDVVPIEQGREVFAASQSAQKRFVEVPGAHHNDLRVSQPPASVAIGEFLDSIR